MALPLTQLIVSGYLCYQGVGNKSLLRKKDCYKYKHYVKLTVKNQWSQSKKALLILLSSIAFER